ncbi:MAG: hypothetical protein JG761_245 [Proteiniphilum sp.]|jgi:uncharacterized membrane protein YbjE (DUF340 family)|nr:hypothetical protein [Proteiniphilum sp.]
MTIIPVFLSILGGIAVGYLLRQKKIVKKTGMMLSMVIMLLLFFLGITVGSNQQVVNRFATIGLDALLLTLGGTLGSLLAARWLYKRLFQHHDNDSLQPGKDNGRKR